jgi:hypothetical protein
MSDFNLEAKLWWSYLTEDQRDLLSETEILLKREQNIGEGVFHDYAFVVFPAAKAYEGFLKKLFFDLNLIDTRQYYGNHFRIGRALNPSLPVRFRGKNWVYGRLSEQCEGEDLPAHLWEAWRQSRNLLFHWFPKHENFINLPEARKRVELIVTAIDRSFSECKVKK